MGAIQGSINSVIGTAAIAAGAGKHFKELEQAKQADIAETQGLMENLQLQGEGLSEQEAGEFQKHEAITGIGGKLIGDEPTYTADATLNGEKATDPSGKQITSTYTHSQIKARLANKVSYQNALAKAEQNAQYRARVKAVLGGKK